MTGSNDALGARFGELESNIETFKVSFEALLTTLTSVKHVALGDISVPNGITPVPSLVSGVKSYSSTVITKLVSMPEFSEEAPLQDTCNSIDCSQFLDPGTLHSKSRSGQALRLSQSAILDEFWGGHASQEHAEEARLTWRSPEMHQISKLVTLTKSGSMTRHTVHKENWPATLSVDWPRSLASRHATVANGDHEVERHMRNAIHAMINKSKELGRLDESEFTIADSDPGPTARSGKFVLTPTHPLRLFFDICSIVCLCYDLITIPYFLAWGVEVAGFLHFMQAAVMLYWTFDLFASFRTGYIDDGEVVTDSLKIAKRYLKGPFLIEFAIVAVDWIGFVIGMSATRSSAESTLNMIRIGKLSRVLRLMGVVRVAKVTDAFHRILDRNVSRGVVLALELLRLIIAIIYVNHVLGCVWFALSHSEVSSDTGARWTDQLIAGQGGLYGGTTAVFQYFTAFHWSLTQMTPGSMQVSAQNSAERIFNVTCLLFGMLFFSSLISNLSAKIVAVRMLNAAANSKLNAMMHFLRERNVDSSLALRVKRQVTERMQFQNPWRQQHVEALHLLSAKLQAELRLTISKPLTSTHPVFVIMFRLAKHHASQICFHAMEFIAYNRHEVLFIAGEDCNKAYVISQGSLAYTQTPETALVCETEAHRVDAVSWLCEASLWSQWIHVGTAECMDVVEVLDVKAAQLIDTTGKNIVLKYFVSNFGRAYYRHLVSLGHAYALSDQCGDMLDNSHILSRMDKDFSLLISFVSLQMFYETSILRYGEKNVQLLTEEVRLGQTTLIPRSDTHVERCVHVSCLRLYRDDGHFLVLLGKWDPVEKRLAVRVELPGTKLMGWENPELALARSIKEDFAILKEFIVLEELVKEQEEQRSSNYGILTNYTRNIFEATVKDFPEFTDPQLPLRTAPSARTRRRTYKERRCFTCVTFKNQRHVQVYAWCPIEQFEAIAGPRNSSVAEQLMQDFDISEAIEMSLEKVEKTPQSRITALEL